MTQQVTDVRTLEGLLNKKVNPRILTKVNDSKPRIVVPIDLKDEKGMLLFVYNKFSPKESDMEKYGIIAIEYDEGYAGIPVSKFKPRCRKKIRDQILESPSFKTLTEKYAIKRGYNNAQQVI